MLQIELVLLVMLIMILFIVWREEKYQQKLRIPTARIQSIWNGMERRERERVNLVLKARYQVTRNHHKIQGSSFSEDISLGGMRLVTYEKLRQGEELELEMEMLPHEILKCKARVVWIKDLEQKEKRGFMVGVQFTELSKAVAKHLEGFMTANTSAVAAWAA